MENKEKYYNALVRNNGRLNEIELGETLWLKEDETMEIIARLLTEHRIAYKTNNACNYSIMARRKTK